MRTSDDYRRPAAAEFCGDCVGVRCGRCIGGDSDYVNGFVEIDFLNDFVRVVDLPMWWGVCRDEWHCQLGESNETAMTDVAGFGGFSRNQFDAILLLGHWIPFGFCSQAGARGAVSADSA